jgi:hypothetical protein
MLKRILPLLLLLTLTGCWNDDKTATAPSGDANTTEVIDGHVLPPEPDPKVNNATLLGIDSNNNGVRDDVERWIYSRYDTYYPCEDNVKKLFLMAGRFY